MNLLFISWTLFFFAFFLYVFSAVSFFVAISGRKWRGNTPEQHTERWGKYGYTLAAAGFILQTGFVALRWMIGGHAPTSNMFEFTSFLSYCVVLAFLIIHRLYRQPAVGIFVLPLAIVLIAYASVFPKNITPLIPALQSYWLQIHVTFAALGEGAFAIAFAAGLLYLVITADQTRGSWETRLLEFTFWTILAFVAFVLLSGTFKAAGFAEQFRVIGENGQEQIVEYTLPSLAGPHNGTRITNNGIPPLFQTPAWMRGANAGNKLNNLIWSFLGGTVLYAVLRLIARGRLAKAIQKWVKNMDAETVDEISYRSIAIGYPIFTLGALIFAMIWAAEAWGRFWGWDPKETWAFITWLFYGIYLHLRLSTGWHGKRSAWLAVLGFVVVMFTLIGVNLLIVGLHSYA